MTEAEWLVSLNTRSMMNAVRDKGSERLWRLFAVACVRRVEGLMRNVRSRKALIVAERFANGKATREELQSAEDAGCTDPDILEHLRESGSHVPGCWAVDAILGKS